MAALLGTPTARKKARTEDVCVLDASVTLAMLFEDEIDAYAESVENAMESISAIVPPIWPLEICNTLLVSERRERTTSAHTIQFLRLLSDLPITVDHQSDLHRCPDILRIAQNHNLSAYDASYLELALRRDLPIATLDSRLRKAAAAAGIVLFQP